ncbi:MAG: hypothetical protein FWG70_10740 [Oscillospiraceae bacterium]|nr:hypothetical protein [Oscillospiraceae bacterium]
MDSFMEQIVVKKTETRDIIKRFAFFILGMLLCLFFVTLLRIFPAFSMIFLFMSAGVIWLTWVLFQSTFVEYEYILTNNELDIDKIIARKKRKRLITIRIDKAEAWGEYSEDKAGGVQVTVQAHDCGYKNLWYIVTNHEKHGKVRLFFSPSRALLEAMNKGVPYAQRKKELKETEKGENEKAAQNKD